MAGNLEKILMSLYGTEIGGLAMDSGRDGISLKCRYFDTAHRLSQISFVKTWFCASRAGIHEHNITKRLESFGLCYSQLLLLADFCPLYGFLRLEFSTATAVREGDLALRLFTFKTTI